MKQRVLDLLQRARSELTRASVELAQVADELESVPEWDCGSDLIEIRARVDALEARVSAIERQ